MILSLKRQRGKRISGRVPVLVWILVFVFELAAIPVAIDASSLEAGKYLKTFVFPHYWMDFCLKVGQTLLPDFFGLLFGYIQRPFPAWIREPGRWIFVLPAILFPCLLVASYFTNTHQLLFDVFGERGRDYEGAGVLALTFPAVGICLYSIGIRMGDRHTDPLANVHEDEDLSQFGPLKPEIKAADSQSAGN